MPGFLYKCMNLQRHLQRRKNKQCPEVYAAGLLSKQITIKRKLISNHDTTGAYI